MKSQTETFWNYFLTIKDRLMDIDSLTDDKADELLESLDAELKRFSQGVDFILSDLTSKGRTLTLTANGDVEYFEDVISLTESFPVTDFWDVVAFLPAEGKNQSMDFEGVKLHSKDLFFLPMESDEVSDKIGIQTAAKGLVKNDATLSCAYLLCEKMIGEYNAATLIDYFDIVTLPEDYTEQGFLPLDYLPDFTEWKFERINQSK